MTSSQFPSPSTPCPSSRTLKIEAEGDFAAKRVKPKIRLMGRWLKKAGFSPGGRVQVLWVGPGILELRTTSPQSPRQAGAVTLDQPNVG